MSPASRTTDRPSGPAALFGTVFGAIGRRRAIVWLVVASVIVAIGTAGYVVLQGWSVGDALYMTVITLTTVGFKEVADLDGVGRAWTMLLAIAAVGIIFGTVGLVAEALLSDATSGRREAKRMDQTLAALRDHYIVCGYGRVGSTVAQELVHSGHQVVVVDIRPESLEARPGRRATWWWPATGPRTRSCAGPGSSGRRAWSPRSTPTRTTSSSPSAPGR